MSRYELEPRDANGRLDIAIALASPWAVIPNDLLAALIADRGGPP